MPQGWKKREKKFFSSTLIHVLNFISFFFWSCARIGTPYKTCNKKSKKSNPRNGDFYPEHIYMYMIFFYFFFFKERRAVWIIVYIAYKRKLKIDLMRYARDVLGTLNIKERLCDYLRRRFKVLYHEKRKIYLRSKCCFKFAENVTPN